VLQDVRSDSHVARLLELLTASHFRLFCTPIVNLFRQHGEPIRITHRAVSYPVIAEARRAFAYEVYSIDSVKLVRQQAHEESVIEFRPFYSLHRRIGADRPLLVRAPQRLGRAKSPGYETEISIVDIDFEPTSPQTDTLSLDLTCTNRDLPAMLAFGLEGGDLFQEGGAQTSGISMLRRPTQSVRFERGRAAHWRLVSHLALNHVSLVAHGLAPLKEMLTLYDLRRTAVSMRQIDGLAGVEQRGAVQWLPGKPFATFVRGIEIRLTIDEEHFVGASLASFVRVLDSFFGLYVPQQFRSTSRGVEAHRRGDHRCKPRTGESILA
jgi:type VI secretion system protein ImpG